MKKESSIKICLSLNVRCHFTNIPQDTPTKIFSPRYSTLVGKVFQVAFLYEFVEKLRSITLEPCKSIQRSLSFFLRD